MLRKYRKPLIVMTPKSLLRHKMSVSELSELSAGSFQLVIPDAADIDLQQVRRLVFCSGKVYYDLQEAREINNLKNVALIRIEQLYPFPIEDYGATLAQYPNAEDIIWCQEEPQNQGAWYQIRHRLHDPMSDNQQLYYAGRASAAAPASGIFKLHAQQQQALVEAALDIQTRASRSTKPKGKEFKKK
jgi:2-oxoglutarate dehydrogenase E1 component